jgi:aspartate aminotransferase-like enzyme
MVVPECSSGVPSKEQGSETISTVCSSIILASEACAVELKKEGQKMRDLSKEYRRLVAFVRQLLSEVEFKVWKSLT